MAYRHRGMAPPPAPADRTSVRRFVRHLFSLLTIVLAFTGGWTHARLAVACLLADAGDAARWRIAVRLAPEDARLQLRYAQSGFSPGERAFEEALRTAPRWAQAHLAYAAWLDGEGRGQEAERRYLEASSLDAGMRPRFALANYYYRAGNQAAFLEWSKRAAAVPRANLEGIFALAERATPDVAAALREILPPQPEAWRQCLDYYLRRQQWRTVRWVADRLAPEARREDTGRLLWYADFELLFGDPRLSLQVWNRLVGAGGTPGPPLSPAAGPWLANPSWEAAPTHRAFDWRIREEEGASVTIAGRPRALRLELSGKQPPGGDFVQQFVYLTPARRYRFSLEARAEGLAEPSGLAWVALDGRTGAPLAELPLATTGWKTHHLDFRCPALQPLVRLALRYARPPGWPRAAGWAEFRELSLAESGGTGR
jgi:hypothetical protein